MNLRTLISVPAIIAVALLSLPPLPVSAGTGSITGHLIDGDSGTLGAAGVTVQACTAGGCQGSAVSDANGNYTLTGVASATWSVVTFPTMVCAASEFGRAKVDGVTVTDGMTTAAPDMVLTRAKGGIAGTIRDKNTNTPIPNVSIFADDSEQGGNGFNKTTSDVNGHYDIECLPAARGYFVTAEPPSPYSHQADSQFDVTAGQTLAHDVSLTPGSASLFGNIACSGMLCPAPPQNVLVLQFCGAGIPACSLYNTLPDAKGNFATPAKSLLPGKYTVHVFAPPGYDSAARFDIALQPGQNYGPVNINLVPAIQADSGRIIGQITDAAGAPYANCTINVFNQHPPPVDGNNYAQGFITGVLSDATGHYDTQWTLTPGDQYRLWLNCPGHDVVTTNLDVNGSALTLVHGQTRTVNFFFAEPGRPWTGGSDAIGLASPATDAYFAEGNTTLNPTVAYHEYLTVQNPNAFAEPLTIDYYVGYGDVITKTYQLPAQSRTTLVVNQEVGPNRRVAAHLHVDPVATPGASFVAERPMYFMAPGGIKGGDDVIGAQTPGTTYYFAEGFTGAGFQESLALMNPNPSDAQVNVTYFFTGQAPIVKPYTVPAHSPLSVNVNADVGTYQNVSIQVTSTNAVTFVAERTMYFPFPAPNGRILAGGSTVIGVQQPSAHLNLAEGHVGQGFYEYLTLLNPSANDATATITYNLPGGGQAVKTMAVPANSRVTRLVNVVNGVGDLPDGSDDSVHIDSVQTANPSVAQPLVVERPMYFSFLGRTGGHDAIAVDDSQLSKTFNFAEGFVNTCSGSPCFDEFYTILNNTLNMATVTITYLLPGGGTKAVTFPVGAHSRYTRWVNQDLPNFSSNSAQIASDQPILVERPMYFDF